jgi:Leucine-rich repeat (LRR) protein
VVRYRRRPNKSPSEVYLETVEQIESARRRKISTIYLGKERRALEQIPPLQDLPHVIELSLNGTSVSDLTPLAGLPQLQRLELGNAPVKSLGPIADLGRLEVLTIYQSNVSEWGPLAKLKNLRTISVSKASALDLLPLANLKGLRSLHLTESSVSDIEPLSHLADLRSLWLERLPINDLSSLASLNKLERLTIDDLKDPIDLSFLQHLSNLKLLQIAQQEAVNLSSIFELKNLESLVITRSRRVILPESLAKLENLKVVSFYDTDVRDVRPISLCSNLNTLNLRYTPVDDISPVMNLTKIENLALDHSQIRDLSPVAGMVSLIAGAKLEYQGISFNGCPISDISLLKIAETKNPQRTIDTLNYVRRKLGLAPVSDVIASDQAVDWRSRALQFDQSPLGVRFEAADDYFAIAPSGQQSDEEAGDQRVTRQLHEQIKIKSNELVARTARLGNTPEWQSLSQVSIRFNELIQANIEAVSEHIGLVWAELLAR